MSTTPSPSPARIKAFPLARYWHVVGVESERITGQFIAMVGPGEGNSWITPQEVTIWLDDSRRAGRMVSGRDLTGSVLNGDASLPFHMIREAVRDDVLDVEDEMLAVLVEVDRVARAEASDNPAAPSVSDTAAATITRVLVAHSGWAMTGPDEHDQWEVVCFDCGDGLGNADQLTSDWEHSTGNDHTEWATKGKNPAFEMGLAMHQTQAVLAELGLTVTERSEVLTGKADQ